MDLSKDLKNDNVGMYIPEFDVAICKRIKDKLSVFTAEIVTIIIGIQELLSVQTLLSVAVFNSLNSSETITEDLHKYVSTMMLNIERTGINFRFCQIPAHREY